jgi:hypothetical protein
VHAAIGQSTFYHQFNCTSLETYHRLLMTQIRLEWIRSLKMFG